MSHSLSYLQKYHPAINYEEYSSKLIAKDKLELSFRFFLEPNITFNPRLILPISNDYYLKDLGPLFFNIGLVELISYFKLACPLTININCGSLSDSQLLFWQKLYKLGLGEFFFLNKIDPKILDVINFNYVRSTPSSKLKINHPHRSLLLLAGGKDSTLALELLNRSELQYQPFTLNQSVSVIRSMQIANSRENLIRAERFLDPQILTLNRSGYLNGHTPFSALLSFISSAVAVLNSCSYVITANEASANQSNTNYNDHQINHQYSKSYQYEADFREYLSQNILAGVDYFSLLRPILDIQVAKIFTAFDKQLEAFRSCNVGQKEDRWCNQCPKCAFVYLSFAAFLPLDRLLDIFKENLFFNPAIQQHIADLLGLSEHKPFECVGTFEESALALKLVLEKFDRNDYPSIFIEYIERLKCNGLNLERLNAQLSYWNKEHFLPSAFEELLKKYV